MPLFQPPIDPGMLVKAAAAGIDLSSVIGGLNQPVSNIRVPLLIQKALEICSEVKSLGGALLSAIEKKEGEQLSLLRQAQEMKILELTQDVKFLQWKESENATKSLLKSRDSAYERYKHYQMLLGKKEENFGELESLEIENVELSEDNFDDIHNELVGKYEKEITLEEYPSKKVVQKKLNLDEREDKELNTLMPIALGLEQASMAQDILSTAFSLIPQIDISGKPMGVGSSAEFGGRQLSSFASIGSGITRQIAGITNYKVNSVSKAESYERRSQDWILQNNLAAKELMSIGQQIISSLIREQITKKEYENHKKQIENTKEIDAFMKEKFSNEQLYKWMQSEISKVYYESYKFAFDIAKKAEQTMKYELMRKEADERDFIKFNYWDTGRKGLLSGEGLYMDIKRMEMAYHEYNKREYELTKHISLQQLDPIVLLRLKVEGSCEVTIPEWLFDMDCPGHYMRRIKTVSLSIPCVVGSYTSINCTLSLQKSTLRKSSIGDYIRDTKNEDNRFVDNYGTIQSIVTSNAQNDSGVFELNLKDEKYLPFEGAGVESTWRLELPSEFRQFDYNTISDVIIHMRYTAREGGGSLRGKAEDNIKDFIAVAESTPLVRMFSLQHDFPDEWYRFVNSDDEDFSAKITKEHYPYIVQAGTISVNNVQLLSVKDSELEPITFDGEIYPENGIGDVKIKRNNLNQDQNIFLISEYTLSLS